MARVPQSFVQVDVLIHPDAMEGVSEVLLTLGAKGVADAGTASQRRVTAYFPADGRDEERFHALEERLAQLREAGLQVGVGFISVREVAEQEWGDIWRVHFHAQRISPDLIIVPSWEQYRPRPDEHVIVLDPGAAFGTGGHATTRLCLRALTQHLRPGARVADIGTGSGILAVGAALLGASQVVATDSDGAVLEIAAYNAARNHVDDRIEIIETDLIPRDRGPFDLVLCNILAPEVVRLAADLPLLLAPGGVVIVSGFMLASIPDVAAAIEQAGLRVLAKPEEGEWAAVVAQAPGGEEVT